MNFFDAFFCFRVIQKARCLWNCDDQRFFLKKRRSELSLLKQVITEKVVWRKNLKRTSWHRPFVQSNFLQVCTKERHLQVAGTGTRFKFPSSCYLIKREKSEEKKKTWIASRSCKLQQNSVEMISNICGTSGTGSPWALFSSMCMIKIKLFKGFPWELSIIQVTDANSWQFFLFVNIQSIFSFHSFCTFFFCFTKNYWEET